MFRVQLTAKQTDYIRKQFDSGEGFTSTFEAAAGGSSQPARVTLIFKDKPLCVSEHHYKFTAIDARGRPVSGQLFAHRLALYFEYP